MIITAKIIDVLTNKNLSILEDCILGRRNVGLYSIKTSNRGLIQGEVYIEQDGNYYTLVAYKDYNYVVLPELKRLEVSTLGPLNKSLLTKISLNSIEYLKDKEKQIQVILKYKYIKGPVGEDNGAV